MQRDKDNIALSAFLKIKKRIHLMSGEKIRKKTTDKENNKNTCSARYKEMRFIIFVIFDV